MAQQIAEHGTLAADTQTIKNVTKAFMAGKDEITQAESLLAKAKVTQIEKIKAACAGVKPVNEEQWDATWKPVVQDELQKAGYKKESIPVTASNIKVAVIALTNQIMPNPDETFTAFVTRSRDELKKAELIKTNGAGRKGGDKTEKNVKPSPRRLALELLARGGDQELPDEQVEKRVATLSFLLSQESIWTELGFLENKLRQKLNKPKIAA